MSSVGKHLGISFYEMGTADLALGLALISLVLLVYCVWWLAKLKRRFASAFANLDSNQDLAQTITDYFAKIGTTAKQLDHLQKSYDHLAAIGARSIQKAGIVRFNPFRDTGGDQSFVLALLDNHDSGFLLTSIHGREGTRVYIKPVEYATSKYQLSDEEGAALKAATEPTTAPKARKTSRRAKAK